MKKLTDTLSGIKNIFCRQQNSAEATSAGGVEFTGAALRTRGRGNGMEAHVMTQRGRAGDRN